MGKMRILVLFLAACPFSVGQSAAQGTGSTSNPRIVEVAPGVTYEATPAKTAEDQPWSVHVLRVSRKAKGVVIRAASAAGEMRRELPTEIARMGTKAGEALLGVVNGDYDIAAPYLGVPDGASITSGHLWTTGKVRWPAMALRKKGEPIIAVPSVQMELRAGKLAWPIAALNKPLGSVHGSGPRAYTRAFRETVKSEQPFRAIVIEKLSRPLPLRANQKVRGQVVQVIESATEVAIPPDAIVVAERIPPAAGLSAPAATSNVSAFHSATFAPGQKVDFQIELSMSGRRDLLHVVGGFPIIVQGGKRGIVGEPSANLKLRHPRIAVCYNPREIIFVVVDGRQPQLSVGMTLEELGNLLVSLGCSEAMNTDGGGSSVMAVTLPPAPGATASTGRSQDRPLQIVNSPSDGKERGRGNAWVIVRR